MKNLNDVAKAVTLAEGKKQSISVAQVKEVIKILSDMMKQDTDVIVMLLKRKSK